MGNFKNLKQIIANYEKKGFKTYPTKPIDIRSWIVAVTLAIILTFLYYFLVDYSKQNILMYFLISIFSYTIYKLLELFNILSVTKVKEFHLAFHKPLNDIPDVILTISLIFYCIYEAMSIFREDKNIFLIQNYNVYLYYFAGMLFLWVSFKGVMNTILVKNFIECIFKEVLTLNEYTKNKYLNSLKPKENKPKKRWRFK